MGEVRVKVKLTNGVDEAMVRRGLLTADKIRSYEAEALVDTGRSAIRFAGSRCATSWFGNSRKGEGNPR